MKLSFRDLKQQKFTVEAEPSQTIGEVKEKIATEKGWEAGTQKLIYSGKILADDNTVESYKIDEKGFIVCMVTKPKTAPAAKAAPPATPAQAASTPAQPAAPQPNPASTATNVPATPTPAQPAAGAQQGEQGWNNPSAMLMGSRNEDTIREMEAMGFERSQAERALRAAYFNPDRAIEYLLNGIPENIQAEQRQPPAAQAGAQGATSPPPASAVPAPAAEPASDEPVNLFEAAAAAQGQGGARGGAGRGAAGAGAGLGAGLGAGAGAGAAGQPGQMDMNFLRNSPHFQHLRQLVQQNPAMLEPILQQVAEGNPQLAQMIGQNQDQFLQLLAEDITGGGNAIGGMGDQGPLPPGATPISVSEEERDAIERLCRLGFSRDQVIQAYFACDKNEELAANFLFEQPDDDDQPQQ